MGVLWVRWFGHDLDAPGGFQTRHLHRVGFVDFEDPNAFGFLDPNVVIRVVRNRDMFMRFLGDGVGHKGTSILACYEAAHNLNIAPTCSESVSDSNGNASEMGDCLDEDVTEAEDDTEDEDNIEDNDESRYEDGDLGTEDGEDVGVRTRIDLNFVPYVLVMDCRILLIYHPAETPLLICGFAAHVIYTTYEFYLLYKTIRLSVCSSIVNTRPFWQ
ncbi:hypothetical protein AcV5_003020 [Taiwanofungus camphoratus]|nr:hypothetical protein AcV5_003020 [Antrodia cinnamomea]